MKKQSILGLAIAAVMLMTTGNALALSMNGAGATFPYPIYSKWFHEYNKKTGVKINYQSIGSGGGIRQVIAGTVDFGGTDAPMSPEDRGKVSRGVLHIPTVIGAVAVAYNVQGIGDGLKLTPEVLTAIFMGEIRKWNDPAIKELNPDMNLPDKDITVAHRSDGSGTTAIFVDYLSKVSTKWASNVGKGTAVKWPAGVGGKGNEGVAGLVKQIPGSIGYMELSYALKNKLSMARIRNKSGQYVKPSIDSATAAAAGSLSRMPADYCMFITNASGENSYPISGFTWLMVYGKYDKAKGEALVKFLKWALTDGQKHCEELYYSPLPESLVNKIMTTIKAIQY
jgi:phosphate transport system substrate-binding protein